VGIAFLVGTRLVAVLGSRLGISVPSEVEPVVLVLVFGVVTDYAIFFLSRLRGDLAAGVHGPAAAERALREIGPIVLAAGITVAVASAGLGVAELGFLRAFGPGLAISVAVGLLVSLTFVPAVLALAGRATFWPRGPGAGAAAEPARPGAVLRWATRRPLLAAVACVAALAPLALQADELRAANPLIRGLPADSEPVRAYRAAAAGLVPGLVAPTVIVIEAPELGDRRARLAGLQRAVAAAPGVAGVLGPAQVPLQGEPLGVTVAPEGDAARLFVVLEDDPLSARAIARLEGLRARLPALLAAAGLPAARASIAGDTALVAETVSRTGQDLGRVAPVVMLAVLVVTALFLRALVAPVVLLLVSVVAVLAALGLGAVLVQDVLGFDETTYFVPFAAAVLLVALGSDYNVYLVGGIWREARRRPFRDAVAAGAAQASAPISVASLVLAASFALLALVPVRPFRELALVMTLGCCSMPSSCAPCSCPQSSRCSDAGERGRAARRPTLRPARRRRPRRRARRPRRGRRPRRSGPRGGAASAGAHPGGATRRPPCG
jgi:RND superfamily putative drug exporter